jgi:hypothetical protein
LTGSTSEAQTLLSERSSTRVQVKSELEEVLLVPRFLGFVK